jgi:hypothetical protein
MITSSGAVTTAQYGGPERERWLLVPDISRRALLRAGVTAGALAGPVVWAGQSSAATPRPTANAERALLVAKQPATWTRANFQPHLDRSFTLSGVHTRVTVILASIDSLAGAPPHAAQDRFSLLFRAHRSVDIPAGLYTLRGAHFRALTMFITPVDRGRKARYLQAVVNRLA